MHSEGGKCTSDELFKIIESIKPEVIFEEISIDISDKIYNQHFPNEFLEVKCIRNYIKNYPINHITVDIDASPNLSKNEIDFMFDTFKSYDVYKSIEQEQKLLIEQYGFAFLNSKKCSELFDEIMHTEKYLIGFGINKSKLLRIHKLFHEEQDNRENAMLQNIYNYGNENPFNQAVFLIGCAHRKSVAQKIAKFETKEKLKLNWTFYNEK